MHQGVLKNESLADTTSEVSVGSISQPSQNVNTFFLFPPKPTEYIIAEKDFVDTVRKMGYNEEQIPFYKCA